MKKKWTYLILISSMLISSLITYELTRIKVDRTPIWHPFELNSNIDLQSLVADGYRCMAWPCGQPQFIKTVGDTSIQYDVSSIDCESYDGHFVIEFEEEPYEFTDEELNHRDTSNVIDSVDYISNVLSDSANHFERIAEWKERHAKNPYFPYDIDSIKNCYQGIKWRVYSILMKDIDSVGIVEFVEKNDGYITQFQNWNATSGGSFLVYHIPSDLYFICSIRKDNYYTWDRNINWEFSIIRSIPYLDQERQKFEKKRKEKRAKYYGEDLR